MEAWLSCSYDLIASSTTCLWCWGVWSREFLPHPCYHRTDEKWVQLSYAHNFRAYSPTPSITGLALLCFPAEVQGLFVQDLQLSGTDFSFLWTQVQLSQLLLVLMWGRASLPSLCNCMVDERWGYISQLWAYVIHIFTKRFGSILVARRGTGPIFQRVVACVGQGQL